ncbi:MAG: 2-C-methyl-D-erythritol 2,4-cyclodiphosphate synthase [Verrucomicrobia bacterium CG_4_10_14_3_um_filter_43_23]|nr:MAG: 2-C-methyl-D-erythritol 2,4-cyclodiphosphate synthase [Verrucomicrobia bacterium CG1_02_43_26]PIP58840.1 MAG: 2-C-methyl-D-erythritol 2,4-cyclodiphosphate synthase [Verrucomicrobia bacterium CG22_combo_CG10-13_8_21_14_all_43_17]PIX57764.1 MAG: 2-C-methyl-D-erythritol 2,4-cyclodiphosphate synthase [Verrucomicrobia bacterium CG_4_10_14_3_um_filter_43_23]PIY61070.1 MAG: 2-C-methyl-D-erythritol 2,4-cyclodiphosphate synthase [Verrucomicrobia bacterium CG_4_10_14_0_8_um_filter_43_34]PJA44232.
MSAPFRIGYGYDIHPFEEGRRLILGGVDIPFEKGLKGHSDADCLSHAIADAILGAAGLSDIGTYFPNTDSKWKDMDSQDILRKASREINAHGYLVGNIDAMIIAEEPKLSPYLAQMKEILSKSLSLPVTSIGIKATTNEGVGDIGRGLAIAAHATCLIYKHA